MRAIYFLITIIKRDYCEAYITFYERRGLAAIFSTPCNGTAQRKMLDYLGIEKTEKAMLFSMVSDEVKKSLMHDLVYEMDIDVPGNGIALTVPVGSIGGTLSMKYLTEGQVIKISEENEMKEAPYELIVAITDQGNTELVMDAARSANAKGGTVIHAKGTSTEHAEKFFGVSIADEKEIVFIVARNQDKNGIMKARCCTRL